jgi:sugar-phosphatase
MSQGQPRRAVVFDMDGVLVDSEPLWHEAEIDVFGGYGVALSVAVCQQTTGVRIDAVVRHWRGKFPACFADVVDQDVVDRVVAAVIARVEHRGTPMAGALAAIDDVGARGWRIGLASSSPLRIIEAVLRRLEVGHRFDAVVSAELLPRGKPDPLVYRQACRALDVDEAFAVAVEDSSSGIQAGKAAGMYVVAVPDAAAARPGALDEADVVIGSLLELPAALDRWSR